MESNLLLEQYGRFKRLSLEASPYKCLLNTDIDLNPHQINAFIAAIQALKTGGLILADEVGLGKTIEAGLTLRYALDMGARKVMIALPATLRMQWEAELDEKFGLKARILDRLTVEKDYHAAKRWIEARENVRIVLASYDYASKFMKRFPEVKWDLVIIDEAHNLRNVFHKRKRAKNLYEITKGIPKILLTATPLQNSLSDLHGLVSFVDPRIFGTEKYFSRMYEEAGDYDGLKEKLRPVLYRTLRRDVVKYMAFSKRTCRTVDFHLSEEEKQLYDMVNAFLMREKLYSIPTSKNSGLILLVIRKLLASSSYALVETFQVLKKRLEKLYEGTKSANAQDGFDLFWSFVEDEMEEDDEEPEDDETAVQKAQIQDELEEVRAIIEAASSIRRNAKIEALKSALQISFDQQEKEGRSPKAVVFTESKRTQKYIAEELRDSDYSEDDILLFNGDYDDVMTKQIYRAWRARNYDKPDRGKNVEYKHAIVDYFSSHAKVLIVTDAGSEGLNLQYCSTVINYDLPWNPQKIEQRIGRCHRYGQKYDVVAINLLNTDNEADRRVYEILSRKFSLFEGVFGASDVALGALESGESFEKSILEIYQKCSTVQDIDREFDRLNRRLDAGQNLQADQLRSLLLTESPEAKGAALDNTKAEIDRYLADVSYWSQISEPENDSKLYYWEIENWGEEIFGSHGTLFIGAFCDGSKLLFPVLLLCDENGDYIDFEEHDIVSALEHADDEDVRYFKPTEAEQKRYLKIYDRLTAEMLAKYEQSTEPVRQYNEKKLLNWAQIQKEQLQIQIQELRTEVESLLFEEVMARDALQKKDIMKKMVEKKKQLDKLDKEVLRKAKKFDEEAQTDILSFDENLRINPVLLVNIVLKF